jgi:transcription elongation factor Elf1
MGEVIENAGDGVYYCFHCLHKSVIWSCDYDYSDFGLEGEGIVHFLHCENCGAQIEYYVPIEGGDEEDA